MGDWRIDRDARAKALARLRREQVIAESRLTPGERLERASRLSRFGEEHRAAGAPTPPGRSHRPVGGS